MKSWVSLRIDVAKGRTRRGDNVGFCVCMSAKYLKKFVHNERILMKFFGGVGSGPKTNRLLVFGDPSPANFLPFFAPLPVGNFYYS